MGFSGISIWQLLIVLVIVVLIFGTKRLKGMGTDVGGFIKGFRGAMSGDGEEEKNKPASEEKKLAGERESSDVIDGDPDKNREKEESYTQDSHK